MATETSGPDLNSTVLLFAVIVGICFCIFQIRSCAENNDPSEYVQAIESCNKFMSVPVIVGERGSAEKHIIDITASPEVLATLQHCHQTVANKFQIKEKPTITIP